MYGITETTVHVTHWIVTAADCASDSSPIGRPLPGWEVFLADREGRLVPRGCSGEIWVGGAGVARGYLDRDDLTRDRFRDDPFRPGGGRRVYRSGDLARERADGTLEFLGRIDNQVKIRGYRIELGEVAAVLTEHPSVHEALVLAHPGPEGSFLVGYAIPAPGVPFDEAEALRFLRHRLPPYMACSRVVAVPGFPLTAHGKLDRSALPVPADRPPDAAAFVAPRTATEELVATLFSEATGAALVGANDDFFAVGGHSLAAMKVAARLQEVFQVPAGVGLLFDRPNGGASGRVRRRASRDRGRNRSTRVQPREPARWPAADLRARARVSSPAIVPRHDRLPLRGDGRIQRQPRPRSSRAWPDPHTRAPRSLSNHLPRSGRPARAARARPRATVVRTARFLVVAARGGHAQGRAPAARDHVEAVRPGRAAAGRVAAGESGRPRARAAAP